MPSIERFGLMTRQETFSIKEPPLLAQWLTWVAFETAANFCNFSIKPKVVLGEMNLPANPPYLIVLNHRGFFELPALLPVLGYGENWPHCVIRNDTVLKCWWEGVGMIPIRREEADRKALNTAVQCLNEGKVVVILPEGTRGKSKKELEKLNIFKQGAGYIGTKAKVPVIPTAVTGSERMLAMMGKSDFNLWEDWLKNLSSKDRPEIKISFGKPIIGITDREELTQLCLESIAEQIAVLEKK